MTMGVSKEREKKKNFLLLSYNSERSQHTSNKKGQMCKKTQTNIIIPTREEGKDKHTHTHTHTHTPATSFTPGQTH